MLIAQVAPIRRMPGNLNLLDYSLPPNLAKKALIGQLVKIPFRNKEIFGIITAKKNTSDIKKIKAISELAFEKPLLTNSQLEFLKEMAEIYRAPLGFVIKENLPPLQTRKLKKITAQPARISTDVKKYTAPKLFTYQNQAERINYFKKILSGPGQKLILVPELNQLDNLKEITDADSVIFYHSRLSPKEKFQYWWEIYHQEKKVVIGTRAALFLPWQDLRQIVLDDEGNPNYKSYDMAPRYHTRDAVLILAKAQTSAVTLASHTPSVDSYYFAEENVYGRAGALKINGQERTTVINLKDERRSGNYTLMTETLKNYTKNATGDWFFFVNRRGSANFVGCRDCGYHACCPNCHRGLIYHDNTKKLHCHFCKTAFNQEPRCPECQGVNMVMYGAGTQLVENYLKQNFPNRPLVRLDADTIDLVDLNSATENQTIVGTQLAWGKINWNKISLMVMVDADFSMFLPEYKVNENLFQLIRSAEYNLPAAGQLLIQTGHPEQLIFKALQEPNFFYNNELLNRRQWQYPPFYYLIRAYWGEKTAELAGKRGEQIMAKLNELTKTEKQVIIFGPLEMTPNRQNGLYWQVLVVKVPFARYKELTKKIGALLPEDCKFDPNPNTLLSIG